MQSPVAYLKHPLTGILNNYIPLKKQSISLLLSWPRLPITKINLINFINLTINFSSLKPYAITSFVFETPLTVILNNYFPLRNQWINFLLSWTRLLITKINERNFITLIINLCNLYYRKYMGFLLSGVCNIADDRHLK